MPSIVSRNKIYSDLDLGFRINPVTGNIAKKTDIESIKQSVLNILLTSPGERPFDPDFGCDLRGLLFENFDSIVKATIEDQIVTSLTIYEPRIRILDIVIDDESDRNAINVTLEVQIVSPEETITSISFAIERLR